MSYHFKVDENQLTLNCTQERLDEMERVSYSLTKVLGLNTTLDMQHR